MTLPAGHIGSRKQDDRRRIGQTTMAIVKIEKVNLVDAVYRQLREMILSEQIPEGTRLDGENKLAGQFEVSRVVVREALQRLRSDNLIVTRQGLGTFAANPDNFIAAIDQFDLTEETYREFLHFRESVEYKALQLSRTAATDKDYDAVDRCAGGLQQSAVGAHADSESDFDFHFAVVRCGHNVFLDNAMRANRERIIQVFEAMNRIPQSESFGIPAHREIAGLLRARDIKAIIRLYDEMGRYNMVRLADFFKKS